MSKTTSCPESLCSTPFGINEWITRARKAILLRVSTCSTPFGINEWITRSGGGRVVALSMCSTPFGINEWITQSARIANSPSVIVLNAFRHQRMDHAEWRSWRRGGSRGAQRLSASTNGSPALILQQQGDVVRAQRLSASTNGSLRGQANLFFGGHVLNAFRHQRMDHFKF